MAREAEKSARETGRKSDATASSAESKKPTAGAASKFSEAEKASDAETSNSGVDVAGYQNGQYEALRAILNKQSDDAADPIQIVREFASVWLPAHAVDIELLVPALERAEADMDKRSAVQVRKDLLNILLADMLGNGDSGQMMKAKMEALSDALGAVESAVQQEREGLGDEAARLGQTMKDRFERLKRRFGDVDEGEGEALDLLAPRSLSVFTPRQRRRREHEMARYSSSTPDRDERGRFMSDDDRRDMRSGRRDMPERDESGRFMSEGRGSRSRYDEDDDERYGRRSMGRRRDDDEDYRYRSSEGHRGHGGWFGDREGHSEASRRGWDDPRHGESGWYGDREGHSEASRRGWDNPRHGESGWYGDPEGHSEASRRGWEGRSSSPRYRDEDERPYRSRSGNGDRERDESGRFMSEGGRSRSRYEDEDDDRRSSRGRGHGGWSGDPEGHSEAARRGWEHRR
jgi:hypothetical protein